MNNLYLSFSVVFPLFCMMALGYFLKYVRIFNDDFLRQLNNLCFKVFLPLILFVNVYSSDFRTVFSAKLVLFALISVGLCFAGLMLLVPLFEKDVKRQGVVVQGVFRSNYILFGIPITASLFGSENTSVTAILIAFVVPLYNVLSVVALERFQAEHVDLKTIMAGVLRNPLIIGAVAAFFFVFTGIRLPVLLEKTIVDISRIATPLALIVLGGSFAFGGLRHAAKALFFSVLGKLVLVPLVFMPISVCFGFRGVELVALFAMFASPTAVSSYTMAQSKNCDDTLAGQIVVVDSVLSVATVFIGITVLKQLQLI